MDESHACPLSLSIPVIITPELLSVLAVLCLRASSQPQLVGQSGGAEELS